MKIQKRHIILAALVLALGVAVYLNWQFDGSSSLVKETSKQLGEATYVNADAKATADEKGFEKDEGTSISKDDYFLTAETERSQAQDKAIDTAKETVLSAEEDIEIKKEALTSLEKLENMIVAQSNIENILIAKGFSKCLCFISESNCSVAVYKKDMREDSPLIIKDAVISQYPIEFNNITIVEI